MMGILTLNEQIFLLAIWRLKDNAYGVSIRDKIMEVTHKRIVYGTLYNTLDKLVKKGYVVTKKGEPTGERGGRSKIYYFLTREGIKSLEDSKKLQEELWRGIPQITLG